MTEPPEESDEEDGGCDAIHVIIAKDADFFLILDSPCEAFGSLIHILKEHGVCEGGEIGIEERVHLIGVMESSGGEHACEEGVQAEA